MWAANLAMLVAEPGVVKTALIDASYVTKGFSDAKEKEKRKRSENGALWKCLEASLVKQPWAKETKVTSHLPYASVLAGDLSLRSYVLNGLADVAAGAAAQFAQPSPAEIEKGKWWFSNAFKVAMRIAIIEAAHWELTPKLVAAPAAPVIIDIPMPFALRAREEAYKKAGHNLRPRSGLITCTRCRESACKTNVLKWKQPCRSLTVIDPKRARRHQ